MVLAQKFDYIFSGALPGFACRAELYIGTGRTVFKQYMGVRIPANTTNSLKEFK
jgi:hypothetical protein